MVRTLEVGVLSSLAEAFSKWIDHDVSANCWDGYMMSVMFKPLRGATAAIDRQMHDAIENCFYPRLCRQLERHPSRPGRHRFLPYVVLFPDLPGQKSAKRSRWPVSLNGGLHYQGAICISPQARLKELLPDHFVRNHKYYAGEKIERFDLRPIVSAPRDAINYTMKTIMAARTDYDRTIVLPKSTSEIQKPRPFTDDERAFKAIQSSTNWSDELVTTAVSVNAPAEKA